MTEIANGIRPLDALRLNGLGQPDTMCILWLIPRLSGAKDCIEVGSGSGFSASLICDAIRPKGGVLRSCDVNRGALQASHGQISQFGLPNAEYIHMDGVEWARSLPSESVDFAFEDGPHSHDFTSHFMVEMIRVLRPGGHLVVHDSSKNNSGEEVRRACDEFGAAHPDWEHAVIPIGVGVDVFVKPGAKQ